MRKSEREREFCFIGSKNDYFTKKFKLKNSRPFLISFTVDRNGCVDSSNTGITTMNEDLRTEAKRSAVTFKIPASDDRLGKSVDDIAAGKFRNIILY